MPTYIPYFCRPGHKLLSMKKEIKVCILRTVVCYVVLYVLRPFVCLYNVQ